MDTITNTARLALEDGSVWKGQAFGAPGTWWGEVVFNTSLTGYQEILTDPSYAGQIVVMTAPQIGNTGINSDDDEARQAFLSGLIIRQLSPCVSNWRASQSLSDWLAEQGRPGITGIDTRALTRRLRDGGTLKGVLSTRVHAHRCRTGGPGARLARSGRDRSGAECIVRCRLSLARSHSLPTGSSGSGRVISRAPVTGTAWIVTRPVRRFHVVAYDFGIKYGILRRLAS